MTSDALERSILEEMRRRLVTIGNSLADSESLDAGLERQVVSIVREARASSTEEDVPVIAVDYSDPATLAEHGRSSAFRDIDPAEPLMAAEILFDVALPKIAEDARERGVSAVDAARGLHHSIWRRFPPGAIAYVEAMRERLSAAYLEGRVRVSRDLHDSVGQDILAALQQLELAESAEDEAHLRHATSLLREALARVRALALDLRQTTATRGLGDSLEEYVADASSTPGTGISLTVVGRERVLPASTREELMLMAIEATRNARWHAETATRIDIRLKWDDVRLSLRVSDDGSGMGPGREGALGRIGMEERARSIGAALSFESSAGGTTVEVVLPFVGPPRPGL